MSQNDMSLANQSGASFRADANSALQALASTSKGSGRPSTVYAGQPWIDEDTPSSTVWTLYVYDGVDDIEIGKIDTSNNAFSVTTAKGSDVASASTIDLDASYGMIADITGTTTITAVTLGVGRMKLVRFQSALTLTHSSTLVLPGAQNIVTAAGDFAIMVGYAAGVVRVAHYQKASGAGLLGAETTIASATTTDLGTLTSNLTSITGTTTITSLGSSAATTNPLYFCRFTGALTLTHNATSLILPTGANITTVAGDSAIFKYEGSGNWRCINYQRYNAAANWTAYTPTITHTSGSSTNKTVTGMYRRVGDNIEVRAQVLFTGAPGTFTGLVFSLPAGVTFDSSKLIGAPVMGQCMITDGGLNNYSGILLRAGSTTVQAVVIVTSGGYASVAGISNTVPITFGNTDAVDIYLTAPITEWSA